MVSPMRQQIPGTLMGSERRTKADRRRADPPTKSSGGWWIGQGADPGHRALRSGFDRRNGKDRRKRARARVLNIKASSPRLDFVVLEMSPYGLSIETRQPLTIGTSYPLTVQHKKDAATVPARVVWCKLHRTIRVGVDDFEPLYRVGLELQGAGIGPLAALGSLGG